MATSNDPSKTSGRAAATATSLTFPLTETPTLKTRLRFLKYSRLGPQDTMSMETSAVITLPLPLNVADNSSIKSSGEVDLGMLGNVNLPQLNSAYANGGAQGVADMLIKQGESAYAQSVKGYAGPNGSMKALHDLAVIPMPSLNDNGNQMKQMAQRAIGVIQNPHTTTFFEGVNLRAFSLAWRLAARSRQESEELRKIIATIKQRIHPEEAINGFALDYPDLLEVQFLGDAAKHLPKYYRSFVRGFSASPGGGGGLNFFDDGAPTEYELNIDCMELEIVTRNKLDGRKE